MPSFSSLPLRSDSRRVLRHGCRSARNTLGNRPRTHSDALNRPTQIVYPDQTVDFVWDACANGKGRLCRLVDGAAATAYSYDLMGRVTAKTETLGTLTRTTAYTYNAAGQSIQLTTPAGQVVAYEWADGRLAALRVNGATLLADIQYEPFGPVAGWTWGNGATHARRFDLTGRPVAYTLGRDPASGSADVRSLGYDAAGRIRSALSSAATEPNQFHAYDGLDRLVASRVGANTFAYAYDLPGNRTAAAANGATTTNVVAATSNRLSQVGPVALGYDAAGNLTSEGAFAAHTYDAAGRRTGATESGAAWSYAYNALGQRLKKASASSVRLFAYDEAGRLLGEYDAAGKLVQEIVWLDDIPVASLRLPAGASSGPAEVFYIHADHLDTPRRISRPADDKVMWQWEPEPFGHSLPNENPQGAGTFVFNLRFPGQYFDAESGLFYNYFRDYDPSTGRYVQSDPIGLAGGINTYSYVEGNPVSYIDPLGLRGGPGIPGWGGPGPIPPKNRPDGRPWGAGCGDAKSDPFVPDYFPKSCEAHDQCYANQCGKEKCDTDFYNDMRRERPDLPNTAWVYHQAVKRFGGDAYRNAGK